MYKIELSDDIKNRHLKYYKDKVATSFLKCTIDFSIVAQDEIDRVFSRSRANAQKPTCDSLSNQHMEFMCCCKENYEILAIGLPSKLREYIELVKSRFPLVFIMLEETMKLENDTYNNKLLVIFGYDSFVKIYNYNAKDMTKWSTYHYVFMMDVRVCPYCNRQYITPIYKKRGKVRADLDHFYPKSKYPYLSMSIHNLVPACKFCNSSLKGKKEFSPDDINPFEYSYDDYFKFSVDPDDFSIKITKTTSSNKAITNYLEMFKILDLYQYHSNQAEELVRKRMIYTQPYIDGILKENSELFKSEEELLELIVGYVKDSSQINNEALLKLRRDIAEQLGFFDKKQNTKLIEQLKVKIINM